MQSPDTEIWAALMLAINDDDPAPIEVLHSRGALAAVVDAHHPQDEEKRTPLMLAYWFGKARAATALVNGGANYQQQDARGNSAAWYARRYGKGEQVERLGNLIEAGFRRLSMESIIETGERPTTPPPKRRSSGI